MSQFKKADDYKNEAAPAEQFNPEPANSISPTQMMELMKEFAKELKKPDEETQRKLDKERELRLRKAADNRRIATEEAELRQGRWASCSHRKENGKHNFVGQVHSNGLCKALCQTCGWPSDWFEPFPEMLNGGAELRDYNGLTREVIEERSAQLKTKQQQAVVA